MITESSEFESRGECPDCGSSDACALYSDGHTFCFSCQTRHDSPMSNPSKTPKKPTKFVPVEGKHVAHPNRKISQRTCELMDYTYGVFKGKRVHVANYYDAGNTLVGQKIRFPDKEFTILGKITTTLFGRQRCPSKGRRLVITEGEIDALTVYQELGHSWPVVSVPNGAGGAKKSLAANIEFLNGYDEVILMFDSDDVGQEAMRACAELLPGKMKIASLPLKDPNEMLLAGRQKEIMKAVWDAKVYRPDGIYAGTDILDQLTNRPEFESWDYPWPSLNAVTLGLRVDETVMITSGSGMGKSQVAKEIGYHLLKENVKVGWLCLEEGLRKTADILIGLELNRRIHLLRKPHKEEGYLEAFNKTVGSRDANGEPQCYIFDHFGGIQEESLLSKIRYFAQFCDCKFVVLDHISIVVSGSEEKDERKQLDKLMTDLGSLCRELHIGIIAIVHLRRTGGEKGHEDGAKTSLGQLRGSGGIAQLSDIVIGLERNQQHKDKRLRFVTSVRILKNRFEGTTGVCGLLKYDRDSGRITDVTPPDFMEDYVEAPDSNFSDEDKSDF